MRRWVFLLACSLGLSGCIPPRITGSAIPTIAGNDDSLGGQAAPSPSPPWEISTLAGSQAGFQDGTMAKFNSPDGIAVLGEKVFVADASNQRIRLLEEGIVTTLAGSGVSDFRDGVGATARFSHPQDVAVDASGSLFVADTWNHRIRKIAPDRTVSTLAGNGLSGTVDGTGSSARFSHPLGVEVDASGSVYVADSFNHRIRRIDPSGQVTTIAGSSEGDRDGPGTVAQFRFPTDLARDSAGNLWVCDTGNHRIRKISPEGVVSTIAGSESGYRDGPIDGAQFHNPAGIAVDGEKLFISDASNHCVRMVQGEEVSTIADRFNTPGRLACSGGVLFLADTLNHRICKLIPE